MTSVFNDPFGDKEDDKLDADFDDGKHILWKIKSDKLDTFEAINDYIEKLQ